MTPTAAVPPYGAALGPGGPASTPHYAPAPGHQALAADRPATIK